MASWREFQPNLTGVSLRANHARRGEAFENELCQRHNDSLFQSVKQRERFKFSKITLQPKNRITIALFFI